MGGLFGGGSKSTKTQPSTIINENPTPSGSGTPGDDKQQQPSQYRQASIAGMVNPQEYKQSDRNLKAKKTLLGHGPDAKDKAVDILRYG